jgi:hypothetical protein
MAIFIAAVAMTVSGLTLPGRYAGQDPPPNVGQLGVGQVIGGIGLLVLGILRGSRPFAAGVSALTALLALAGFAILMTPTRRDLVLLAALGVAVVAFGGAAVILARLKR